MEQQCAICIIMGASILAAAISSSFLPTTLGDPIVNPMTNTAGGSSGNTTETQQANTTGTPSDSTIMGSPIREPPDPIR